MQINFGGPVAAWWSMASLHYTVGYVTTVMVAIVTRAYHKISVVLFIHHWCINIILIPTSKTFMKSMFIKTTQLHLLYKVAKKFKCKLSVYLNHGFLS